MNYQITHITRYGYNELATLSQNEAYVAPRNTANQVCENFDLAIDPEPAGLLVREDYFGNRQHVFWILEPHLALQITARTRVQVNAPPARDPAASEPWSAVKDRLIDPSDPADIKAAEFAYESPMITVEPKLKEYAQLSFPDGRTILESALDLTRRIFTEFKYDPTATHVGTTVLETLAQRRGVCQDFAHFQIACLRSMGLAARYVSGYLETQPPPGKARLVGADASHAWLSVYAPPFGWVDLDPTNNLQPKDRHVTVAWGRDYGDVTPVKGVVTGGGRHQISVSVDVAPCTP